MQSPLHRAPRHVEGIRDLGERSIDEVVEGDDDAVIRLEALERSFQAVDRVDPRRALRDADVGDRSRFLGVGQALRDRPRREAASGTR